jgi:hypothetical protein
LFGSSTILADGSKAADGYVALRELDTNGDGVVDAKDAGFGNLRVWVDGNSDGISQTAELKTLAALDISSLSLQTQTGVAKDNGNVLGLTSTYQTTDGASHAAADVWFVADKTAATAPLAADAPEVDLVSRVSSLAQAIGTFSATSSEDASTRLPVSEPVATARTSLLATAAVCAMVDAMKQFDANGNQATDPDPALALASAVKVPALTALPHANLATILASGN